MSFSLYLGFMFSFDALVQRFEAPDSRNRWDSPLFTVLKDDILPLEAVSDALFKRKAPPPNQSTQSVRKFTKATLLDVMCVILLRVTKWISFFFLFSQQPLSSTNFLYELDKITQDVLMVRPPLYFCKKNKFQCVWRSASLRLTHNLGNMFKASLKDLSRLVDMTDYHFLYFRHSKLIKSTCCLRVIIFIKHQTELITSLSLNELVLISNFCYF